MQFIPANSNRSYLSEDRVRSIQISKALEQVVPPLSKGREASLPLEVSASY